MGGRDEVDPSPTMGFAVDVAVDRDAGAVVTVFGELDLATAPRLREAFERALETRGDVLVDLRGCGFVDSSGIATLVDAAWRLKDRGGMLRIRGASGRVRQTLELTGLPEHSSVVLESAPPGT